MYDTNKVHLRMLERGLNPLRLSIRAERSSATIHRFFRTGRAHIDTVKGVCRVLGFKVGDILLDKSKNS